MHATGTLTIESFTSTQTFQADMTMTNEPGTIQMVLDATVTVPGGGTAPVAAHNAQVGTVGNIASRAFCAPVCGASPGGSWRAWNDNPFTGGQDPHAYTYVQQSDIDGAANSMVSALAPGTQQGVQGKVNSNEHAIGSPQCKPHSNADHAAGDQATTVTVTVTVTCTLEVYDYNGALALASQLLQNQAKQNPGTGYALTGTILSTLTSATPASGQSGTISLTVNSEGIWVFQFSDAQKQTLKASLAGKHKSAMLSWLESQPGVKTATIQITGSSDLLPGDPSQIMLTIQSVPGLQTTPTS
jgi:VCBS repeat-containing protein